MSSAPSALFTSGAAPAAALSSAPSGQAIQPAPRRRATGQPAGDNPLALIVATRTYPTLELFSSLVDSGTSAVERRFPDGIELLRELEPPIVIAVVDPEDESGLQVISDLRAEFDDFLLLLAPTHRGYAAALLAGVDACLCDSDGRAVFAAQLASVIRRHARLGQNRLIEDPLTPGLVVDFQAQSIQFRGTRVELTSMEWRVFAFLARRRGIVCKPSQIMQAAGHVRDERDASTKMKSCVWRIRTKLKEAGADERIIRNFRNVGYVVEAVD